jgi:hypothetical protein
MAELYVGDLLVMRAGYGDGGREFAFTGVSKAVSMAYEWGSSMKITKLVSYDELSSRRCEIMWEPFGVVRGLGAVVCSWVMKLVEVRKEVAAASPAANACMM